MPQSPILWGAGLACALGGAIAGTTLGSSPLIAAGTSAAYYQSHESGVGQDGEGRVLPDHYPLVTRNGTVPVSQLSDQGLYSQARYREMYGSASDTGDRYAFADVPADEPRFQRADQSASIGEATAPREAEYAPVPAAAPPPPLALADGPATVSSANGGSAKMIDVRAVLAMR